MRCSEEESPNEISHWYNESLWRRYHCDTKTGKAKECLVPGGKGPFLDPKKAAQKWITTRTIIHYYIPSISQWPWGRLTERCSLNHLKPIVSLWLYSTKSGCSTSIFVYWEGISTSNAELVRQAPENQPPPSVPWSWCLVPRRSQPGISWESWIGLMAKSWWKWIDDHPENCDYGILWLYNPTYNHGTYYVDWQEHQKRQKGERKQEASAFDQGP